MKKSEIIKALCNDLLQYPGVLILTEDMMNHLCISAGLIEDHVTGRGCDVLGKTVSELAQYIERHISFCSKKIQDDAYFLLIELSCNTMQ